MTLKAAPKLISVGKALERYGLGRTKFYELIGSGAIRAVKLGSKTLIDVAQADAYFDSLPRAGGPSRRGHQAIWG
jgi:excisionase family DNA binding protein